MNSRKARDWDKTIARLYEEVPAAQDVDWERLFREDPRILGDLINDIIKVNISKRGRPGKRSASSAEDVEADLRRLTDDDYSDVPYEVALPVLMRKRTIRQVANASGIDKMRVHRILNGQGRAVSAEEFEGLAKAFRKKPSFFIEYRAAFICNALYQMLVESPDSAVVFYNKIRAA